MEDNPKGSFWAMRRLLETWAEGAKDRELVRALEILEQELRRRGHEPPCEGKRRRSEGGRQER